VDEPTTVRALELQVKNKTPSLKGVG